MARKGLWRVWAGGFIATFIMTMMIYPMFWAGVPKMDYATMIGSFLMGEPTAPRTEVWWIGMVEHFFNGTVLFPFAYVYWGYRVLPKTPPFGGVAWGLCLWILAQAVAMPLLGQGFFSSKTPNPGLFLLGSGIGHLLYGVAFGSIVGRCLECEGRSENRGSSRPIHRAA